MKQGRKGSFSLKVTTKPVGRRPINGKGRQKKLFQRQPYTYQFKHEVLDFFHNNKDIASTVQRFFPGADTSTRSPKRKLVYKWSAQCDQIASLAESSRRQGHSRVRSTGVGTTLPYEAEQILVKWINDYRRDGVPISSAMLSERAFEVAACFGVSRQDFSASWQWQRGFMKRHKFAFRAKTHQCQITPPDALERAASFTKKVASKSSAENIHVIYNVDQTGVFFELLPRRNISPTRAKTVWIKCEKKEKERVTAMLLADPEGNKYPLFVVRKATPSDIEDACLENARLRHSFGKRVWAEVSMLQDKHDMQIHGNQTAWWNGAMTVEFLRYHFGSRSVFSEPIMLLLDDFSGHWVPDVRSYAIALNITLMKVPPGLTWIC